MLRISKFYTKNTNNEKILKEILSAGNTYCQLGYYYCSNDDKITFDNLISAGVLDEKILDKVNPTINGNTKFSADNFVKISIVDGEKDIIYESCRNINVIDRINPIISITLMNSSTKNRLQIH